MPIRLSEQIQALLACPYCKSKLVVSDIECLCTNEACRSHFPIVNGVPVLLNESSSVFRIQDYANHDGRPRRTEKTLRRVIQKCIPSITHNWVAAHNYARLVRLLKEKNPSPVVLIIGAGEMGEGSQLLLSAPGITVIETDVCLGRNTKVIADGHDLPFLDDSMDAVVIQAVLEHVLDPFRCVAELFRVLKSQGLVYAETPFLYPVHLGPYDFTRFSLNGHRRLFRNFREIDAGVVGGPGMALAVSIRSFMYSLSGSRIVGAFGSVVLPLFLFWLKYVDYFLIGKPRVADYAAGTYFFGAKGSHPVSDIDIIRSHWSQRGTRPGTSLQAPDNPRPTP